MKKDSFLNTIQRYAQGESTACVQGKYTVAWEAAVKTDEKDHRWNLVYHCDGDLSRMMIDFAAAFGVELPAPPSRHKPHLTAVQQLERKIEKMKESLTSITRHDWIAITMEDIARLEKRLEMVREEEAE